MPETRVVFYKEDDGRVPVLDWMRALLDKNEDAFKNCAAAIKELSTFGHELRRPASDYLRDGIRELRTKHQHTQYRILYFFNGKDFAVLAHAIVKKGWEVPDADIERAIKRKRKFEGDPGKHAHEERKEAE